jgi:hypoxanthine-DNA glycosylase
MTGAPSAPLLTSFRPVIGQSSRVIVLGTMPGERSLQAGEYYAHPRNSFWPLMDDILGIPVRTPYSERLELLKVRGLALWDVLASCERTGSLDVAIRNAAPNDFGSLFAAFPRVVAVLFNGRKAEALWRRHVPGLAPSVATGTLPSSSSANAGMSYESKLRVWAEALRKQGLPVRGTS